MIKLVVGPEKYFLKVQYSIEEIKKHKDDILCELENIQTILNSVFIRVDTEKEMPSVTKQMFKLLSILQLRLEKAKIEIDEGIEINFKVGTDCNSSLCVFAFLYLVMLDGDLDSYLKDDKSKIKEDSLVSENVPNEDKLEKINALLYALIK